ncbi:MAG: hypothetical protein RMM98_11255 [Acidobacteriota bacterium]|nr:hypothetical protein [Blastocatellia bacterium]MDW8240184.1 hypothetical protein [Acidobacteriota bacterium]
MNMNIRFSLVIALLFWQQLAPVSGVWPCSIGLKQENQEKATQAQASSENKGTQAGQVDHEAAIQAIEREIAQALNSLNQLVDVTKALDDPITRIRSYASIAEVIWDFDQSYARKLFRMAVEQTTSLASPKPSEESRSCARAYTVEQVRHEVITKISRLDLRLAEELVKSVASNQEPPKERKETPAEPPSSDALLAHAISLLDQDPQKAAELAASTLREGLNSPFIMFMAYVRKKDGALADALFEQALSATLRHPPQCLHELVRLGSYTHPEIPFTARYNYGTEPVKAMHVTAYLNVLVSVIAWNVQRILSPAPTKPSAPDWLCGPWDFFYTLKAIQPYVMQYSPDNGPLVEALIGQLSHILSTKEQQDVQQMLTRQSANPEQRVEDLLQQAEKTLNPEDRDSLLFHAACEAVKANQFDKAWEILAKLANLKLKAEASDYVNYLSVQHAIKTNDLETARRSALALTNPERLILGLIAIARHLGQQKQKDAALATLSEALIRAKQLPGAPGKARSLLLISDTLALLETDRAFEAFTQAATAMNESSGNIECPSEANFQINTKRFGMGHVIAPDNLISMLEQLAYRLTKADVHRTTFAVASLQKPPLRLVTQIAVARGQLEQARERKAKLQLPGSKTPDQNKH